MRLLLVSPDLRLMGGVAETVKTLLGQLEGRVDVTQVMFGARVGQTSLIMRVCRTILDLFYFARMLVSGRFDIVHLNPSLVFVSVLKETVLFILCWLLGYSGRTFIFIHGWDQDFFKRIASGWISAKVMRAVLNRAGLVLVLAEEFRDELIRLGVDESKVEVVSTMVDMDSVPFSSGCARGEKSMLFISRMIVGKGVYEIIDAFSLLSKRYAGLKLVMAGDGPERGRLMELAASRDLRNISFPGHIQGQDKYRALEESCIFLLPTYSEGRPVSLLEAMASGLVPLVTDVGGIKDVTEPDETAVLLPEASAEAIVDGVSRVLDDSALRIRVAGNAQKYARANFCSRQVAERIIGLYSRIIRES
ncbi:glycosyltransferase family 4 protein [Desulfovibrio sp. JC010]|uniref:glycosyltransferase family 4 protein n=1 Tax=Desulfovibrio sp. JC010 TaxID=2593641 RepID=UPI0013D42D14|nr:glycosyltransferase family 4 protein [Desulfovibrio sp. JC010]NDV26502.1 glycosyltransferase family 4 protein [Desulfovibrio sp. JC010]